MALTISQKTFSSSKPTIYLVGTPIGNRQDFSPRAKEVLAKVDVILAEDTRTSQKLLGPNIGKPLVAFHKFNEQKQLKNIKEWLLAGKSLAIISDAGVPLIADPGIVALEKLRLELNNQFFVTAINAGPAFVHAILGSGLGNQNHYFHGFLKARTSNQKLIELSHLIRVFHEQTTIIFYESVHRLTDTLKTLQQLLAPVIEVAVAKELTKLNEEIIRGSLTEVVDFIQQPNFKLKGEFVILIDSQKGSQPAWTSSQILEQLNFFLKQGQTLKQATQIVSDLSHHSKHEIYQLYIRTKS